MNQSEWEASVEWVGVVAGCILKKDNKYLLVQEKQPKVYGLWNIPAGHVDKGETIETAARREVKEETGYSVKLLEKIGIYHESIGRPVKHVFVAVIIGGNLIPQEDEILDAKWLSYEDIKMLNESGKLRASWIWDIIKGLHESAS